jgi:transcriptional regulator with XRE-family HTH domain
VIKSKASITTGQCIRNFRQQFGWSQEVIANLLGISVPAFSKIETGVTDVNLSRLEQIANAFEVNIVNLFSPDQEATPGITPMIESLKKQLAENEMEILKLQHKVIQLYDELYVMSKASATQTPNKIAGTTF